MEKPRIIPTVSFTVDFKLTEREAMALDALAGYGADAFLKVFYKHLGVHYMKPFDKDLRALFEKIKELKPAINTIQDARRKLNMGQLM